jgi:hypothetical protein
MRTHGLLHSICYHDNHGYIVTIAFSVAKFHAKKLRTNFENLCLVPKSVLKLFFFAVQTIFTSVGKGCWTLYRPNSFQNNEQQQLCIAVSSRIEFTLDN